MKEHKIHYIRGKRYWRLEQAKPLQKNYGHIGPESACSGCGLKGQRDTDEVPCPEARDERIIEDNQPLKCQDYELHEDELRSDGFYEDYTPTKDYIFVPATKAGFAQYVAHKMR